jgi:hypothetical protein
LRNCDYESNAQAVVYVCDCSDDGRSYVDDDDADDKQMVWRRVHKGAGHMAGSMRMTPFTSTPNCSASKACEEERRGQKGASEREWKGGGVGG